MQGPNRGLSYYYTQKAIQFISMCFVPIKTFMTSIFVIAAQRGISEDMTCQNIWCKCRGHVSVIMSVQHESVLSMVVRVGQLGV